MEEVWQFGGIEEAILSSCSASSTGSDIQP
jgi:hypothetical protein